MSKVLCSSCGREQSPLFSSCGREQSLYFRCDWNKIPWFYYDEWIHEFVFLSSLLSSLIEKGLSVETGALY